VHQHQQQLSNNTLAHRHGWPLAVVVVQLLPMFLFFFLFTIIDVIALQRLL